MQILPSNPLVSDYSDDDMTAPLEILYSNVRLDMAPSSALATVEQPHQLQLTILSPQPIKSDFQPIVRVPEHRILDQIHNYDLVNDQRFTQSPPPIEPVPIQVPESNPVPRKPPAPVVVIAPLPPPVPQVQQPYTLPWLPPPIVGAGCLYAPQPVPSPTPWSPTGTDTATNLGATKIMTKAYVLKILDWTLKGVELILENVDVRLLLMMA